MSNNTLDNVPSRPHVSVMAKEVLEYMAPESGKIYVDGTFGFGGHTRSLLESTSCTVYALDRDPNVKEFAKALQEEFGDRLVFIEGCFGNMKELLAAQGVYGVDGILLDIGVSSMQIDTPSRGFSFQKDGPLDMRMSAGGRSAADLINHASEEELANIIYRYGGEKKSRYIARAIVSQREDEPFERTAQLAGVVQRTVGRKYNDSIDPATRTFQAIRIWVNDELGELERALDTAEEILLPKGRLVVITFHSGEDAIVKHYMQEKSGKKKSYSRYQPLPEEAGIPPVFEMVTRKAIKPSAEEVGSNVRARSAKIRVVSRTEVPVSN